MIVTRRVESYVLSLSSQSTLMIGGPEKLWLLVLHLDGVRGAYKSRLWERLP